MSGITRSPAIGNSLSASMGGAVGRVINPPSPLPATIGPGSTLRGLVLPSDDPGLLRLQTNVGEMMVRTSQRLPPGSVVSLQFRAIGPQVHVLVLPDHGQAAAKAAAGFTMPAGSPSPERPSIAPAAPHLLALVAGKWESLETLLRSPTNSQLTQGGAVLPNPGAQMAAAWIFLLRTLAVGRPQEWLNRLVESAGRSDERISGEVARLARVAGETDSDGWRHLPFPLQLSHHVGLHWLHLHGDLERSNPDGPGTRFLLDFELPRLGEIQIDGLLHTPRFALILRSREALSEALQSSLMSVHREACELMRLFGTLKFEVGEDWQRLPPPASLADEVPVTV